MNIWIYHLTDISNLESIIKSKGLLSHNEMLKDHIQYTSIAYEGIQDKRATIAVPCGSGGFLHDYVPFFFAPRPPMLYTIGRGNVRGCPQGQGTIIHIVSTAEIISENKIPFVFSDGHGIMHLSEFYDSLSNLNKIDWGVMKSKIWKDTTQFPDRKRRRQAEFLVFKFFPLDLVKGVGVYDDRCNKTVMDLFAKNNLKTIVKIKKNWYY